MSDLEEPKPLSGGVKDPFNKYYIPYKEIVTRLIQPSQVLIDFDKYQNFTAKIFLNYFIKKKYQIIFPAAKKVYRRYLFPIPERDSLTSSKKKFFDEVIIKIENHLDIFYENYPDKTWADQDLLGKIYNEILYGKRKVQKRKGQFFTPGSIVKSMVTEGMRFFKDKGKVPERVLDPSGGAGIFLNSIFIKLKKEYVKNGLNNEEASRHILDNVLWAVDLDPIAVFLMKINLSFLAGIPSLFPKNIFVGDFIFKKGHPEYAFGRRSLDNIVFDWIIGNPPWGSKLSGEESGEIRKNYLVGQGEINSYTAFLEHSISLLRQGGLLSKLLPESVLNIRAHKIIRKVILDETKILAVNLLGEVFKNVFAPSVYLHAEKQFMATGNVLSLVGKSGRRNVYQEKFRSNPHYIFTIHSTPTSENILSLVERGQDRLGNHGQFYMGVVTGSNEKFIFPNKFHEKAERIITGKDLSPYYIRPPANWIYFKSDLFQQVSKEYHFRKKNKLIYKFISNSLKFAVDRSGRVHLNSVNGYYLEKNEYTPEFLAALLNSRLINFYFTHHFFTRRVLRGDLEMLPIVNPCKDYLTGITQASEEYETFINSNTPKLSPKEKKIRPAGKKSKSITPNEDRDGLVRIQESLRRRIEEMVMDLYKIPSYLRRSLEEKAI